MHPAQSRLLREEGWRQRSNGLLVTPEFCEGDGVIEGHFLHIRGVRLGHTDIQAAPPLGFLLFTEVGEEHRLGAEEIQIIRRGFQPLAHLVQRRVPLNAGGFGVAQQGIGEAGVIPFWSTIAFAGEEFRRECIQHPDASLWFGSG